MRPVLPAAAALAAVAIASTTAFAQEGSPPEPVRATPQDRLAAPGDTKPSVKLALDAIKADRGGLSSAQRKGVNSRLTSISAALRRGDSCDAVAALSSLRRGVGASRGVTGDAGRPRMNVAAAALQAEALLKFGKGAKSCGGATTPPRSALGRQVSNSSPKGLTVRLGLPVPRFDATTIDQKSFVGLRVGSLQNQGTPGQPALPISSHLIAIPDGATVKVTPGESSSIRLDAVDLAPAQEEAPDQELNSESPELRTPAFKLSTDAYSKRAAFPPRSFTLQPVGELGGVRLAVVHVPAARYVPGSRRLQVFTSAELTFEFVGGKGTFGDKRLALQRNADVAQALSASTLNFKAVAGALGNITIKPCGDDLIVITTPELKSAADRLAAARNAKGIKTEVFTYGAAPVGGTKEALRTFIQSRVKVPECEKTVKWVVLLGDSNLIPTWTTLREDNNEQIPSDLPYSQTSLSLYFPNVAVGRIPAGTLAQADTAIDKQIAYTDTPTADPAFYQNAAVAGFFQVKECNDDGCSFPNGKFRESRRYMTSITRVRTGLRAFGKTVDTYVSRGADATPVFLNEGGLLPLDLIGQGPYTGTGTQIRDALNAGRWLLVHRDHAGPSGWGDPSFNAATVNTLTNGNKLPLVLSINCSSGAFDGAGQSTFTDAFMFNPNGGAVGVVAATRVTPSFTNEEFARPLVNALTGGRVPTGALFPGTFAPLNRVSSMLVYAKVQLLLKASPASFRNMMRLYQYFGDPSVRIHVSKPA